MAKDAEPIWLRWPWAQIALAAGIVPLAYDPGAIQSAAALGAAAGGAGALVWWLLRWPQRQSDEDLASHSWICGLTRSGKTAFAILRLLRWSQAGHGWAWLSIKGAGSILPYLPPEALGRCDLLAPASPRPRGLNLLRLYTETAQEREQVADQVAALYRRQHSAMSGNMLELIRMGALALLHYAQAIGTEVTLVDLYRLFTRDAYRARVLQADGQSWAVVDAFREAEGGTNDRTLDAVRRQLRRPVAAEALLVTLARKGAGTIDLRQVLSEGRWLAVDVSDAALGPEQAGFLNQAVASKLQLLTPGRGGSASLFHIVADEAQEFAGNGEAFAKAVALAAEYRVAWTLINQSRAGQLTSGLDAAVTMAASHYYFRQAVADAPAAAKALAGAVTPEQLVHLAKRRYWAVERIQGEAVIRRGHTPDLPLSRPKVVAAIQEANQQGPSREQILAGIRSAQQAEVISLWA